MTSKIRKTNFRPCEHSKLKIYHDTNQNRHRCEFRVAYLKKRACACVASRNHFPGHTVQPIHCIIEHVSAFTYHTMLLYMHTNLENLHY